jgi:hypothetical protein
MIKLNLNNTTRIISELKNIDLETADVFEIKRLLSEIIAIPLPIIKSTKGASIVRSRIIKDNEEIFTKQAQLSMPKRRKFFTIGRANTNYTNAF